MFDTFGPMVSPSADVTAALATLRSRWGAAAPRRAADRSLAGPDDPPAVVGALATMPLPEESDDPVAERSLVPGAGLGRVVSTGFPALDAILGPGGVPRTAALAIRGSGTSGATTLALRLVAEAQAAGSIVAWLDAGRSLDPVEAVARGVRLEWLVSLVPADLDEGLAMAGALLAARAVDVLVLDLPTDLTVEARIVEAGTARPRPAGTGRARPPSLADRLGRIAALARRADTLLLVLEPPGVSRSLAGAVGETAGLRLELARRSWVRLGRDVVGHRTEVVVARNRYGPPGRRAELRILYAEGGPRDACLAQAALLVEQPPPGPSLAQPTSIPAVLAPSTDATPPSPLAAPPPPARPVTLHVVSGGPGRAGRPAVDRRDGARREPRRAGDRRPSGHGPGHRPPARAGGDVPRSGT